jgi:hypothetical protein
MSHQFPLKMAIVLDWVIFSAQLSQVKTWRFYRAGILGRKSESVVLIWRYRSGPRWS